MSRCDIYRKFSFDTEIFEIQFLPTERAQHLQLIDFGIFRSLTHHLKIGLTSNRKDSCANDTKNLTRL